MYLPSSLIVLLTAAGTCVNAQAKLIDCYGYSGRLYANNTRCPGSNACCDPKDECLSNRLCHKKNDGPGTFIRAPCAIDPYDSGTCAQICLYNETGILPRVRICTDGSLCCDNDSRCCENGDGVFLDNKGFIADSAPSTTFTWGPERTSSGFQTATDETSSTPSSVETSTDSSTSSSATSAPSTNPDSNPNSNDGDKQTDSDDDNSSLSIGLGVGLGVGIPLIAAAVGIWFCISRKKRRNAAAPAHELQTPMTEPATFGTPPSHQPPQSEAEKYRYAGRMPHEMMSPSVSEMGRSELSHEPAPVEADGRQLRPVELST